MLLLPTAKLPENPNWLYEIKLDGFRAIARLLSRAMANPISARGTGADLERPPGITSGPLEGAKLINHAARRAAILWAVELATS